MRRSRSASRATRSRLRRNLGVGGRQQLQSGEGADATSVEPWGLERTCLGMLHLMYTARYAYLYYRQLTGGIDFAMTGREQSFAQRSLISSPDSSRADATRSGLAEQVGEDGCLADVASLRRAEQGEPSVTGQLAKMGERGGTLWIAELGAIAAGELGVPVGIMAVPLS